MVKPVVVSKQEGAQEPRCLGFVWQQRIEPRQRGLTEVY